MRMELLQLRYKTPSMLKPITAAQLWERLGGRSATMTTGLSRLDTFLGGGLACGEITEIVGPSASGKTQFCALLAAAAVIQSGKRVLILDTGSSLMASRVVEIARNRATRVSLNTANLDGVYSRRCVGCLFLRQGWFVTFLGYTVTFMER
jgi:RecA/RadA recombinase